MNDQLMIYLCQPKKTIKKVNVSRKATIKELGTLFPNQNKCFIFKGMILSESQKLESYGIQNLDHIVVISNDSNERFPSNQIVWMNATKDQADFNERMRLNTNINTRAEAARLKDIKMSKIEMKRRSFTKIVSRLQSEINKSQEEAPKHIHITNIQKPTAPCHEPLPIFWATPKRPHFSIFRGTSEPEISIEKPIKIKQE